MPRRQGPYEELAKIPVIYREPSAAELRPTPEQVEEIENLQRKPTRDWQVFQ